MARISRDEYDRMMQMMGAGSQRISEEEYDYMKGILDGDIPTAPRYTVDDVVSRTNDLINSYSSDVRSGQNFSRVTGSAGGRDVTGEDYYQRRMEGMRRYLDTVLEYAKESNDFDLAGSVLYSRQRLGISDEEPSFEWNDDLYSNSGYILDKLDNASGVQRDRSVEEYKENETDPIDENVAEILDFYAQRPATQSTTSMPSDTGSTFNEEEYLGRIADNYGASINSAADAAAAYYGYVSSAPPDQLDPEVLKFYLDKMNEAETERNDLRDQSISAEQGRARNWFADNEDYYSGIQNRKDFSENIAGWDNEIIPSYANATPEAEAYFGYINTTDPNNRDPRLESELRRRYEEAARNIVEETRPMTDEQKQIRAYILNTEGEQAAREYDRYLDYQFNAQNAQRVSEAAEQNTDTLAGKIVSTGVSVPANLAGGLLGTIDILAQNARNSLGDYRPVDYNSPAQSIGTYAREVRENVTDDIDSNVGKFLYGTGTSMLDSVAALATGNAGGALLGLSAAQNAVYDAVDAGATDTQALGIGLLNGAAEMFFEDISLSNLDAFMTTDARGIKNFVKNLLKQSFTEGSEEFFTTVANTLTDALVMQDRSEINRNIETYINNGYDEKDATKMAAMDWFKNASLDMLGGFLSGGILGGAGQAIGNYESNRASGEQVRRSGRIDSLLNYANDFGTESQKRAAGQILQNREKASDAKIGSLYNSIAAQNDQQTSYIDLLDRLEENYQVSMASNAQDSAEISAPTPYYDEAGANIPVEAKTAQIEEKQANRATLESAESVSRETPSSVSNLNIKNESGDGISVPAVLNDGSNATVVGISETGGDIMLDMADGKTVSPDDVSFNDPSVQRLIDESEKFDAQGATDFLMNYDGTNVDTYIRGYNAAYESGRLGMDYESFTQKRGAASLISEEAARSAFDAGLRMSDMRRSSPNVSGGVVLKTTQNLSASQKNQIGIIDAFASAIGRTINVIDSISENDASGRIMSIAANAMFDPTTNEYTIALDADAEAYIPIAMHESVHDISRNAQKEYAALRDSVFKWLQESGSDIDSIRNDWKERIPDKDDAYYDEEIVANTVPAILKDSATAQEFADRFLDTSEKKNAFVRLIDSIIDFMRNAVEKLRSLKSWDSMRAVENNIQAIEDIREKLFAGYSAIIEKSTQSATQSVSESEKLESISESAFGSFDSNNVTSGETDIVFSLKNDSVLMDKAESKNNSLGVIDKSIMDEARDAREAIKAILDTIKNLLPEDIEGNTMYGNRSYSKTLENALVCIRTLAYDDFCRRVTDELKRPLTVQESLLVSQFLPEIATYPQCVYCYVSNDRKAYEEYVLKYTRDILRGISMVNNGSSISDAYESVFGESPSKTKESTFKWFAAAAQKGKRIITLNDVRNPETRARLRSDSAIGQQIKKIERYAGNASWAKKRTSYVAYNGNILNMRESTVNTLNDLYGLRMYSFSDFSPAFILENMQMITDASIKRLKMLAYTKDVSFAKIFAKTRMLINVSCYANQNADGTFTENSSYGVSWKDAQSVRNQYENVGVVMVVTNDAGVEWALSQDWIDVVIPFHIVKTGHEVAKFFDWVNYTYESSDKLNNKSTNILPNEHGNDKQTFLSLCEKNGITPRFSRFVDNPNYMKLVNETRLAYNEAKPVVPVFDVEAAKESLSNFVDQGGYYGSFYKQGANVDQAVGEIVGRIKDSETRLSPKEEQTTKQTLRENENLRRANEILRAEMKRSKVFGVDRKAMQGIAKEFASEFDIPRGFDSRSFGDTLYRIYNAMINEGMSYDDGVAILQNEVKSLFESMPEKFDSVAYKEDAPIREYLRGKRLNITADVYRDAMTRYTATASEYRGLLRGFGITTSKDGVGIDTFWREASEKFPYIFSEDIISPEQQVETLADILKNSLHKDNYFVDRFEYGIDEAALDAAVTILDKAFMTDPYQTFADKQHAKLKASVKKAREASKQRYRARIDALESKYKAEISELKLDVRHGKSEIRSLEKSLTRQSKLYDRLVERSGKKEAKLMQQLMKARQRADSRNRNKYAYRIYRDAEVMFKWLSQPTNTRHIPEKVRNAVVTVLNSLRFEDSSIAKTKSKNWAASLDALSNMISNQDIDSEIEEFSMYLDPDLPSDIKEFLSSSKSLNLEEMSMKELRRLSGLVRRIRTAITTINMMHGQESAIYVSDVANETVRDMRKIIAKKGNTPVARAARAALSGVTFLDQLDFYHFSKMLGGGSMRIYNGLRDGFDNYVNMIEEAVSFEKENLSGVDSASISGKNNANIEVETEDGSIKLTRAQIMYLYLLSKRENAKSHLFDGGEGIVSVFDDDQESFRVTEDQVAKAIGKLSEAEKEAADRMQQFMEVNCANWGNEATLKEYGYKKFGERNYVPMTVKQATVATRRSEERGRSTNLMAIPNRGFTKQVSGEATNALVIDDIFSVFARHVSDMAEYSAYLSPIVDTVKWLNWRGEIDGKRIYLKDEIARAFPGKKSSSGKRGKSQAVTYIENFIKNLSRAYSSDLTDTLYSKLIGLGKGAAVGMNLSVAIQQPSAYGRAIGVISAESLTKALARKPSVDIMKRYSPIGLWKSWGFYDRNIGRSIEEIILNRSTLYDSVRDKQMILAEKADEITWGMLWNACEEEIISRGIMSEKDRGTDAFYKEAANLFRVVIDDTQVVDTVFNRAPAQRDSAKLLLTTFQSETMKTYGSMLSALWDTRIHGNKDNRFVRYIAGAAASQIIAAALQAAVGAMRDEDDEKGDDAIEKLLIKLGIIQEYGRYTYGEKYAVRFVENAVDNLNPLRLHWMSSAVVDTIESVFKGFSQSSRIDTKVFEVAGRLITSVKNAIENKSIDDIDKIIFRTAELASYASGVGFANAFRDIKGLYNTLTSALSDPDEHSSVESGIRAIENGEAGEVDIQLYISNRADEIMENYPAYTYERAVEEAKSDARSAVTRMYKDEYVSAIRSGDTKRANEIVSNMVKTGLYGSGRDAENEARDIAVKWVISSLKSEYLQASSQSQRERIIEQLYSTRYWRSRNELRKAIESWTE